MDNKVKELISISFLFTLANLGSKILVFLMVPFYTYILTPSEYGITGIVQTSAALMLPLMTGKIQDAVLRFCFVKDYTRSQVFTIGLKVCLLGTILSFLITALFFNLPLFKEVGIYIIFVPLSVFSTSIVNLLSNFARGIDDVKISAVSGVINTFIVVSLNLLFLLVFKLGITGYLLSYFIADIVSIVYLLLSGKLFNYISFNTDISLTKTMLAFSLPLVPTSLSWWLLGSFNNYYILSVLGTAAVGLFTAAMRVPSILTVLSDIFSQAWLLSALKNYGSDENKQFIRTVHRKFFSMLCFMTGGITLLTYPLSRFLLSGDFINSWNIIPLLFVSVFWGALVGFYGVVFSAENKTKIHLVSTVLGAIVSVIIVVLLLNKIGLIAVSIAIMVGYYIVWLIRKFALRDFIDIGMSTFQCSIHGIMLTAIAVLVSFQLYLMASLIFLIQVFINRIELYNIFQFIYKESGAYIKRKI